MKEKIAIRKYQPSDIKALADIYYHTIHNVNIRDYSQEQVNAWAPTSCLELDGWQKKWEKLPPFVAEINDKIVGFAEFEDNGHIDCFYVHHQWQGKNVGSALLAAAENHARQQNISRIFAQVSITAKPFFERNGFNVVKEQIIVLRGVELKNSVMEKML